MMNSGSKTALVTGGAMGYKNGGPSIGGAIALRLARDGFQVVIVDESDMGRATMDKIKEAGGKALFIRADVTKSPEIQAALQQVESQFGGLHCLVNCVSRFSAGMAKNVAEITEEEWDKTLAVNLNGYFKMAKYSVPLMLKSGGGSIVNISSIETYTALPNFSVYSVAKGGVDALTRTLAVDFAPEIRTNSVAPGFVKIANSENDRSPEELAAWHKGIAKQYPMKRLCEADEVAGVVSFLASKDASYVNGQSIVVDGGKTIADMHEF